MCNEPGRADYLPMMAPSQMKTFMSAPPPGSRYQSDYNEIGTEVGAPVFREKYPPPERGERGTWHQSLGPASLMLTQTGDTSGASDLTMAHEPDMGWRDQGTQFIHMRCCKIQKSYEIVHIKFSALLISRR